MTQGAEVSNSTEISVKFTVLMHCRLILYVVQSAVHDLSACHAIVLRIGCNIRVVALRAMLRKAKLSGRGTKCREEKMTLSLPVGTTSAITPTVITVCGFHQLDTIP